MADPTPAELKDGLVHIEVYPLLVQLTGAAAAARGVVLPDDIRATVMHHLREAYSCLFKSKV